MKRLSKVMLAVAMLFTVTLSANAQYSRRGGSRTPDRFHMGIHGGFTSNTYTGDFDTDPYVAPTIGIAADFQVAPVPVFVGIGLNYMNYGFKVKTGRDPWRGRTSHSESCSALQVPVTGSYHINVAPDLFINPFLGGFFAVNLDSPSGVEDFNGGVRLGCGLNYKRLTFELGYDAGVVDLGKDCELNTGTFFMTVGYNWAGDR